MTNYFTFIVQSSLIDEKHLVKFGQSDQMPVNLQISEFIAGRQLPMSPLPYTNMAESKPTFRPYINFLKLQIQPYHGNTLEWLTFWDSFNNAVHYNPIYITSTRWIT